MSLVQLVAADFDQSVPQLLRNANVVAVVPATELRGWAAEMAWQLARAAAGTGRRTALIDCFVNAPSLHTIAGAKNETGLVDAFEYGASFNKIVQQQPQASLFFIPSGTYKEDAQPLMEHPRWKRLSAGFRHEEALLLLYVGAEHLAGLAAEPDGVIVLAPQGLDLAVSEATAPLADAVGRGKVLAVVADEEALARNQVSGVGPQVSGVGDRVSGVRAQVSGVGGRVSESRGPLPDTRHPTPVTSVRRSRASAPMSMLVQQNQPANWPARAGIAAGLAAAGFLVWYAVTQTRVFETSHADGNAAPAAESAAAAPVARPPSESLPWTIQIASRPRLDAAFALADSLEAIGAPTIIAPVRLQNRAPFYRVHAGPYASAARAESALTQLRSRGAIDSATGQALSTPLSVSLATGLTRDASLAERTRLRLAGVPVFVLGHDDGTFSLHAGAYDASAQATLLQDLLTPTGDAGALAPRAGYVP